MAHQSRRFSSPGNILSVYGEGQGLGVVMGTSRHKGEYDIYMARRALADAVVDELGWDDEGTVLLARMEIDKLVEFCKPLIWHSVTELERHGEFCEWLCDVGSFCSEGAGKDWTRVLCLLLEDASAVLDPLRDKALV